MSSEAILQGIAIDLKRIADALDRPHFEKVRTMGEASAMQRDPTQRIRACGCIVCVCEDEVRCHGCGAKMCDGHQPSRQARRLADAVRADEMQPGAEG